MTSVAWLVSAAAVGLVSGAAGAALMLARVRRTGRPVDLPDPRRLHAVPTPRGGGIGILLAGVAAFPLAMTAANIAERDRLFVLLLVWALPNGVLGTIDDHRALSPWLKLLLQVLLSIGAVALGLRVVEIGVPPVGTLRLGWLGPIFCVCWLVWMANLFNFMDGMDALAAECGAIFFVGLATLALMADSPGLSSVSFSIAGALVGFLYFNLPPARIFMGDGGSLFAGAIMGGVAMALARTDVAGVPLAASAVLVGTFAFDATFTVVRRATRGQVLRPHRTHFYQRLVLAGWSQRSVRMLYVCLSLIGFGGAIALLRGQPTLQVLLIAVNTTGLSAIVLITRRAEARTR